MKTSVSTKGSLRIKTLAGAVENVLAREENPEELQTFINKFILPSLVRSQDSHEKDLLLDQLSLVYQRIDQLTAELSAK